MGIAAGWEIVSVQGEPVRSYAEREVAPSQPASTPQDRLSRAYERSCSRRSGSAVEVGFRDQRGRTRTLALPRIGKNSESRSARREAFDGSMLPGDIAWVQLRSSMTTVRRGLRGRLRRHRQGATRLILDVRENGGGNSGVGLADPRHARPSNPSRRPSGARASTGPPSAPGASRGSATSGSRGSIAPKPACTRRPGHTLTSPRTYSAAEDFAVAFDAMRRGRIVGKPPAEARPAAQVQLPGGGRVGCAPSATPIRMARSSSASACTPTCGSRAEHGRPRRRPRHRAGTGGCALARPLKVYRTTR